MTRKEFEEYHLRPEMIALRRVSREVWNACARPSYSRSKELEEQVQRQGGMNSGRAHETGMVVAQHEPRPTLPPQPR